MTVLILLFIEGMFAFVSPCILPLLPIYLIYLSGDEEKSTRRLLINTLGFVLGFSLFFMALGVTATFIGQYLQAHRSALMMGGGLFTTLLGLSYLLQGQSWFKLPSWRKGSDRTGMQKPKGLRFFTSLLFGMAFCTGWTPCLATWLASALTLSANAETWVQGAGMLLVFALGLGLPFIVSALAYQKLRSHLRFFQTHSQALRLVSGLLLIALGLFMASGHMDAYLQLFQ